MMTDHASHTVEFVVEPADFDALGRFYYAQPGGMRQYIRNLAQWCAVIAALPLIPAFIARQPFTLAHWIVSAFAAGGLGYWLYSMRRQTLRGWRRYVDSPEGRIHLGRMVVIVSPDGLEWHTEDSYIRVGWKRVDRILDEPDAVYLSVDGSSGVRIPRRAFADDEARRAFLDDATRFWQQSAGPERRCPQCGYERTGLRDAGCPECGWNRSTQPDAGT